MGPETQALNLAAVQRQYGGAAPDAPRPADMFSLRSELNAQVERARILASRAHELADSVFGCRPDAGSNASIGLASAAPGPLAELVEDLGRALSRLESGLNRL